MKQIQWKKEVIKVIQDELNSLSFKPTVRTMFYRLFSKELISNTHSTYVAMDKATVRARWEGTLAMDCFADNTRQVVGSFNEDYYTPNEVIDFRINNLLNTEQDYADFIPRWHNQPHYVEIWTEKDAMVGTFQSILEGYQVRIVPNRGFSSMIFLHETIQRLKRFQSKGKYIHILYYGDFDPSGHSMDTDLKNRMKKMGLDVDNKDNGVTFERIAVTLKQIEQYDLPYDPDKATAEKMKGDRRTNGFLKKFGKLYAVEIDALPAKMPDIFRQELVIDKIEQYYDEDIYQELLDKYSQSDIKKSLTDGIKILKKVVDKSTKGKAKG
jgi:hypothetical protein